MIYTGLNNTGEVEAVYAAKRATITGTPPLSYPSKGYDLEDFLISGSTVQDGTPSPSDPADVVGCGERTGNLFDKNTAIVYNAQIDNSTSSWGAISNARSLRIPCDSNTQYTIHIQTKLTAFRVAYTSSSDIPDENNPVSVEIAYFGDDISCTFTTSSDTKYIIFQGPRAMLDTWLDELMLNKGSTPLPYEPYGYKLPITCGGVTNNIYLGNVQTTRKIKKFVLDGTETWGINEIDDKYRFNLPTSTFNGLPQTAAVSTHFAFSGFDAMHGNNGEITGTASASAFRIYFWSTMYTTTDAWKAYLAQQYSAGTPVTVWYVLAVPETTTLNEPLHKIGDYADSISLSQSGLTVPTIAGINTITTDTTVLPSSISVTTPEKEVAEVYAGINYQNPIYYKSRTLTGTLPLTYKGLGQPLKDYNISGNTVQNGTPTPSASVDVVGCGERTGNLCPMMFSHTGIGNDVGNIVTMNTRLWGAKIEVSPSQDYCTEIDGEASNGEALCFNRIIQYDANGDFISRISVVNQTSAAFTTDASCHYVVLDIRTINLTVNIEQNDINTIMLNTGSTALPYEPYGYKLPITCGGVTNNIYLGNVQTTRRIKKLVLTGEEPWFGYSSSTSGIGVALNIASMLQNGRTIGCCTHFVAQQTPVGSSVDGITFGASNNTLYITFSSVTVAEFNLTDTASIKSYLAAQYAAGTPVTVWYVLATPETTILNEPLHKIGDYADAITMAQAGVILPTTAGTNTLTVGTTVQPSSMSITGNIKEFGYRFVEYLKSTGTQYIVTDIVPTYSTRTELDCKFDVTNYDNVHVVFFGIQIGGNLGADSKWYFTSLEKGSSSPRRNCGFFIGFTWYSGISSSYLITDVSYNNRNVVVCNHPQSAYGSNSTTITEQVTLQQPNVGVAFFGVTGRNAANCHAFNVGDMYLYGAKMYDDGNLSHNLIPVERVQDNELGLLDTVTGKFYTNTGTGTFIKGNYLLEG